MGEHLELQPTGIDGLCVLQRSPKGDSRGYLERLYCGRELADAMGGRELAQVNHTYTRERGAVRGMHFQYPPHAETKYVSCLRGEVFDVAVDLRRGSPTFLHWHAEILTGDNHRTLVIPEGFAHGYQTLTTDCDLLYLHSNYYRPDAEGGLHAQDPALAIDWPLPVQGLSDRDLAHQPMDDAFRGLEL